MGKEACVSTQPLVQPIIKLLANQGILTCTLTLSYAFMFFSLVLPINFQQNSFVKSVHPPQAG